MKKSSLVSAVVEANPNWGYKRVAEHLGIAYSSARYHMNSTYRKRVHERRLALSRKRMMELRMSAGGKCQICGYDKCLEALHFHHLDPSDKLVEISEAVRGINSTYEDIGAEVKKCRLVCANCHAEIHSKSGGQGETRTLKGFPGSF